jgi:hypothetical protein
MIHAVNYSRAFSNVPCHSYSLTILSFSRPDKELVVEIKLNNKEEVDVVEDNADDNSKEEDVVNRLLVVARR